MAGLQDVLWWVLSFGSGARVLGPEELQRMVSEEIARMKTTQA
ncbi:MAG: WYL domain-containing protein [Planctomycetes bacterium]|nr:WYL domain-containing protein [Planctomycetota bacterium]